MNTPLPKLSELILPSFLSLRKGVRISPAGIHLTDVFKAVEIEQIALKKYVDFIGFSEKMPLTYLYILAQRAQVATMLTRAFTIAIPGMVHLENKLLKLADFDFNQSFDLKVAVDVSYKERGSLIPVFRVDYFQHEIRVATCKSVYLAKRRHRNGKKRQKAIEKKDLSFTVLETWDLPASIGKTYAKVSGDKNPIHTNCLFAKLLGFKKPIAHGWYSISRLVKSIENLHDQKIKSIQVAFKAPVFLPGTQQLEIKTAKKSEIEFLLREIPGNRITLTGTCSL